MIRRIAIFSFFDNDGVADLYIDYLLNELNTVTDRLIIVVNGKIDECSKNRLLKYTNEIVVRENKGFDAGAYADILLNYLEKKELKNWDELILCNDTFYGPFIPMKIIFDKMASRNMDFWGLNLVDRKLLTHIQSYFLVFKKQVFQEEIFLEYFRNNIYCNETNIINIYGVFEVGLFKELTTFGYVYDAYCNTQLHDIYKSTRLCMECYGLPILKKKSMQTSFHSITSQLNFLNYILYNTSYDINLIIDNAKRQYGFSKSVEDVYRYRDTFLETDSPVPEAVLTEEQLLKWIGDDLFYIYGTGSIARQLFQLYLKNKNNFLGFLVSEDYEVLRKPLFGYPVKSFKEVNSLEKIVIGMSKGHSLEIKKKLGVNEKYLYLWN